MAVTAWDSLDSSGNHMDWDNPDSSDPHYVEAIFKALIERGEAVGLTHHSLWRYFNTGYKGFSDSPHACFQEYARQADAMLRAVGNSGFYVNHARGFNFVENWNRLCFQDLLNEAEIESYSVPTTGSLVKSDESIAWMKSVKKCMDVCQHIYMSTGIVAWEDEDGIFRMRVHGESAYSPSTEGTPIPITISNTEDEDTFEVLVVIDSWYRNLATFFSEPFGLWVYHDKYRCTPGSIDCSSAFKFIA
jgi:hypothetical protein